MEDYTSSKFQKKITFYDKSFLFGKWFVSVKGSKESFSNVGDDEMPKMTSISSWLFK